VKTESEKHETNKNTKNKLDIIISTLNNKETTIEPIPIEVE